MLSGEMAKYQIQDRVRDAEEYRVAKASRQRRTEANRARVRKVGSGLLAALTWPVRH